MSSTTLTDTDVPPGSGRHYYRDVIVRETAQGLALRVYGHVACSQRAAVERVLETLTNAFDPAGLTDGDVVATLRLVPRAKHVEVVHERGGA